MSKEGLGVAQREGVWGGVSVWGRGRSDSEPGDVREAMGMKLGKNAGGRKSEGPPFWLFRRGL